MMILFIALFLPALEAVWEDLPDDDCYHCIRYNGNGELLTSQGLVDKTLVVGGKNLVLKLDFENQIDDQFPDRDISTQSSTQDPAYNDYTNCLDAGRTKVMCANYYKVIIPIDSSTVLLCGTSAYSPQCDFRQIRDLSYSKRRDVVSGEGLCPANPDISVTYTKISPGVGFAGTCRSVCNDNAISRMNLQAGSLVATARTFYTKEVLSGADFVYSFEEGDFVYFLFKETALEEKREYVYSRVGRLCKNDVGSSSVFFKDLFKTFFKARIYCTSNQPGETPFDHNELGGAWYEDKVLYTAFSGPKNLYAGSIICKYTLQELEDVFRGKYKVHDQATNRWEPLVNRHPVQCSTHPNITAASKIVLMYDPIYSSTPLFSSPERLKGLVGRNLTAFNTLFYELFSSDGSGNVVRLTYEKENPHAIYNQHLKAGNSEVTSLLLDDSTIYALSDTSVTMIPSDYDCSRPKTCQSCMSHHYPMCGWCYGEGTWSCTEASSCSAEWLSPLSTCEEPPMFTVVPKNETFREGETVILNCASHDNHPFFWTKKGGPIARKSQLMNNGYMLIPLLKAEDEGCYWCNMNNTSGAVHAEACLTVLVAPAFSPEGKPEDTSIQVGYSDLLLPCSGSGSPKPNASWERLGAKLPEGSVVLQDGTLKLIRVMTIDEGQYRCVLQNKEGKVVTVISLRVDSPTDVIRNGTEEQLNGNQMNRKTIITLIICVLAVVFCFIVGFMAFTYRRKKRKRGQHIQHEYLENDNPMALDSPLPLAGSLQALHNHWPCLPVEETPLPTPDHRALTSLPEGGQDEAPPAYTEHPHIYRGESDYNFLSFPSSTSPVLYQPLAQHAGEAGCRDPGPGCRDPGPGCRDPGVGCRDPGPGCRDPGPVPGPRFITSLPDTSPGFIDTLPVNRGHVTCDLLRDNDQYDVMPSHGNGMRRYSEPNDPPD